MDMYLINLTKQNSDMKNHKYGTATNLEQTSSERNVCKLSA